ncbi:endonuclease-reverse transcriptase [Elysia marginata]|uniref:Endonuclease-reverse transcriptase n=1 Tax=Elysia marginata TaxID=1093978 RepID=A0AAV4EXM5_9GAST|nr:endonuclease-reverse transcriptase [Elysia marginata]
MRAIKSLKNNKAPGPDGLNAELFKADPELAAEVLLPLLTKAWKEKKIPEEWNEGVIIKIPKKGNLSDCNNWRGITLLSIPSKVLAKIVIGWISGAIEEQADFRPGRGCTDQIFTLRNIIEQCTEWQRDLYINFIDFEKAFDSVHRNSLWKILRYYRISSEIVSMIKCFYNKVPQPVQIDETILPFREKFTYLGSCVTPDGGAKDDIINRLDKSQNCLQDA